MKKLFQFYKKKSQKESDLIRQKCFTSLYDLPVHNWFQVNKENNHGQLFKEFKEPSEKELPYLHTLHGELMEEYIDLFGFSANSIRIFQAKKRIAMKQLQYMITEDRKLLTQIEIDELSLKSLIDEEIDVNLYELKPKVEKIHGRYIDFKKESVVEWHNLLKTIN